MENSSLSGKGDCSGAMLSYLEVHLLLSPLKMPRCAEMVKRHVVVKGKWRLDPFYWHNANPLMFLCRHNIMRKTMSRCVMISEACVKGRTNTVTVEFVCLWVEAWASTLVQPWSAGTGRRTKCSEGAGFAAMWQFLTSFKKEPHFSL